MAAGYPMLVAAIRSCEIKQWRVARMAGIPNWRLSNLIQRGGATPDERARLSDLLGVSEAVLFGAGLAVTLKEDSPQEHGPAKRSRPATARRTHAEPGPAAGPGRAA